MTFVIQLFDKEGYYSSETGDTLPEVKERAKVRGERAKTLIAMSVPFEGTMSGQLRDVTLPPEFKSELAGVNKSAKEEAL